MNKVKVLVIQASTRTGALEQQVMTRLTAMCNFDLELQICDMVSDMPLFNPNTDPASIVIDFCKLVRNTDGIIIYLPELTFGVPGAFNNAMKWASAYDVFLNKFVAITTTAKPNNQLVQTAINEASARLYPITTLRTYYLPQVLGLGNDKAEQQCSRIMQNMLTDLRNNTSRRKMHEVA